MGTKDFHAMGSILDAFERKLDCFCMGTKDFHAMGSILDGFERFSFVWVREFKKFMCYG